MAQSSSLSQSTHPTIEPQSGLEPQRDAAIDNAMDRLIESPTKENSPPFDSDGTSTEPDLKRNATIKASPSSAMPSRNSPLSWQRRPNSQASDRPRSRPLSMVATENAARSPRATPEPSSATESTPTRDQIAQSLASKDPAWFRQTADRGLNSPAYRRNQVEDEDRSDHGSNPIRVQMPGMSREGSQSEKTEEEPVDRSSLPSRSTVSYGSGSRSLQNASSSGIGSPLPLTPSQRLDPPGDSKSEARALAMSPSQGRISPERLDRPISPTKGMGGFVQSAMMKRSDSVSKRWSVQSPPGLSRGNSVASNRSSHDVSNTASLGSIVSATARDSRPSSLSRDNSPHPSSRPGSSHSNATITQERPGTSSSMQSSMTISTTSTTNDGFVKPSLPASRTPSAVKTTQEELTSAQVETTPPTSPSKTMDPKRWSPTKSSWLESALNKPESPKPKAVPPPQQPAWMSDINRAKQKGSVDLGRSPTVGPKHEVKVGGLMRSPPPGGLAKPLSIGGLPAGFSSGMTSKNRPESRSSQRTESPNPEDSNEISSSTSTPLSKFSPADRKVKPETPPKKDFRSGLKPRKPPSNTGGAEEPEFKNVFGQLRRTKTQNYVAPNELKDNITRGKAALNITGGPKKTERTDEFKEALLKKKEDFKKAQSEGKGVTRSTSGGSQETALPEALAKRQALGRSDSITGSDSGTLGSHSRPREDQEIPKPGPPLKEMSAPGRLQGKEAVGGKLAGRFNPALAGLLARGPPSMASDTSRSSSPASSQRTVSMSTSTTNPETPEAGPQLTHMTKARARGPRRKAPSSVPAAAAPVPTDARTPKLDPVADKKRPANVSPVETQLASKSAAPSQESPSKPKSANPASPSKADADDTASQPSSPRKLDMKRRSHFLQELPNKNNKAEPQLDPPRPLSIAKKANTPETPVKAQEPKPETKIAPNPRTKPSTPVKSSSLSLKSPPITTTPKFEDSLETAKLRPAPLSPIKVASAQPPNVSNGPEDLTPRAGRSHQPVNSSNAEEVVSVRNVAALWGRSSPSKPEDEPPRTRSPIKLPTQADEKAAMIGAGLRSPSPEKRNAPTGRGLVVRDLPVRPLPTSQAKAPKSPPPSAGFRSSTASSKPQHSAVPRSSEASRVLVEFFGERKSRTEFLADTAAILSARPGQESNIKTLRSSLYQLSADGKKQLVPNHQERILFEGNLYLCTHTFGNAAGKKVTEVYYWFGDEVPNGVVDEAEIFAQREAKAAGGKLVKIRQGKETPEFFHALGGIIIIRRGSSNKYDSLAPHILCGRKHFGQIAFDEVDFSVTSLCSGFPYLISTQPGKSYLWKGKGSGIDELSCARLIGMDFGITGEIEEVEDGNESAPFLQIFGNGAKIPKSADHWRMKPNYNKYCGRLFCASANAGEQVSHQFLLSVKSCSTRLLFESVTNVMLDHRNQPILPV